MNNIKYKLRTFHVTASYAAEGDPVTDYALAVAALHGIFADLDADVENFVVLVLNARGRVTGFKAVAKGTATASLVHPREVFRAAMLLGAVQIIVAHNHPSGDASPSDDDIRLTQRLGDAGRLLGVPVIDHIIITPAQLHSLAGHLT